MSKIKKPVYSALFLALAVAISYYSIIVPFGGAFGMRIGFSGLFSKLPAILFGPVYGGAASGAMDILGFLVKPMGDYILPFTLTAAIGGFIVGILCKFSDCINVKMFRRIFVCVVALCGIFGIANLAVVRLAPSSAYAQLLLSMGEKRTPFMLVGLVIAAAFGAVLYFTVTIIKKKIPKIDDDYIKMFTILLIANLIVTTLNTFVLRIYYPTLAKLPFWMFYTPRLIEEIIMTVIQAYGVTAILRVYKRIVNRTI